MFHFKVTLAALEDSIIITWSIKELREFLEEEPFLSIILKLLIGKDISNKMYQIQELLMKNPTYMQSPSRHSSIANLRSTVTVVSNVSDPNIKHLNCFGVQLKGMHTINNRF